jgi:dTMP kinase
MPTGLFIVLEGIDGAGTTTQARLLVDWLQAAGRQVVLTAEPTHGPIGSTIRQILRGRLMQSPAGKPLPVEEETMALLFAADRADHLRNTVLPALEAGAIVVSDRHYLSSLAYQALGVDMEWVASLNSRFRRPDLTVMLDVDPQVSLCRKQAQGLAVERYEHLHFLDRVRANYRKAAELAQAAGERVTWLDGGASIAVVQEQVRRLVEPLVASGVSP